LRIQWKHKSSLKKADQVYEFDFSKTNQNTSTNRNPIIQRDQSFIISSERENDPKTHALETIPEENSNFSLLNT
jgi:hypothetical protein